MKRLTGMVVVTLALLLAACQPIPPLVESDKREVEFEDLITALAIVDEVEKEVKEYEVLLRFFFSCSDRVLVDTYEAETLKALSEAHRDALKYVFLGVYVASAQLDASATADGQHESSVGIGQDGASVSDQIEAATEMCNRLVGETG